jgi:predicted GNAT superfamily acetyltransferase
VRVRELTDIAAHHQVAALFERIWRAPVVDASTLHAFSHVGNYVAGAFDGDELVGAAVGFFAVDGHLHSHITGVAPGQQGRGTGFALKQHQREWVLARGRTTISWTFDPLMARNAYFNLHKLGAVITEYLPDFYGPMHDGINAGDATDRLFVRWGLNDPVAPVPDTVGAAVLLGVEANAPVPGSCQGSRAVVATPRDVEQIRADDPDLAQRWRIAVREALVGAFDAGYRIVGITKDGRYLLEAS